MAQPSGSTPAAWPGKPTAAGFTLLELLLATVLILLLLGAAAFNFNQLQRGATLEEGAAQFEGLVRFARAQAAHSGRAVQINFDAALVEGLPVLWGGLRVLWEPDPLERPGHWTEWVQASPLAREVNSRVAVWAVRTGEPGSGLESLEPAAEAEGMEHEQEMMLWGLWPPITFYPDGSSDSAEVILISRDADDTRQVIVVLDGLSGRIYRTIQPAPTQTQGNPVESGTPPPTAPRRRPQPEPAPANHSVTSAAGSAAPQASAGGLSRAAVRSGLG